MIPINLNSVYTTNSQGQADIVAAWLQENGLDARVNSNTSLGGLPEMILWSKTESASGAFEVWVPTDSINAAKTMISEWETCQRQATAERMAKGSVDAVCDSCGELNTLPPEKRGAVETCRNCGLYFDVPK